MGQRKAALKDRVDGLRLIELEEEVAAIGNGWLIFTVDVVRNKCFNKDYWIRFTMQLKLRDM